ncbi:hypothetical protein F383_33940 [Gossypium arboreum]|uniref:Uncharacterized protein n=1 Tax=Gossypium arboreum TaxID=29729 RepID=A0A0B0PRC7_GOSAR|nr:hypothetical protein F383_33940 [Gossypium arboreum]
MLYPLNCHDSVGSMARPCESCKPWSTPPKATGMLRPCDLLDLVCFVPF